MAEARGEAKKAAAFPTSSVPMDFQFNNATQENKAKKGHKKFWKAPADSSFWRGALADEQSIIISMKPIAFAARLLSGPDDKYPRHKSPCIRK